MGCYNNKARVSVRTRSIVSDSLSSETLRFSKRSDKRRKLSSNLETESDYWGTVPFYVLKNQVRLLAFEIKDSKIVQKVQDDMMEILKYFVLNFEIKNKRNLESKKFEWITKYQHGDRVIKSLGIMHTNGHLELNEGVTREHLKNKVKETKFAFISLKDTDIRNGTV